MKAALFLMRVLREELGTKYTNLSEGCFYFLCMYFLLETCRARFDSLLPLWIFNNVADS